MVLDDKKIEKILKEGSYVSNEDVETAKKSQKQSKLSLIDSLYSLNILNKDLFGQAVSEHLNLPYADLNSNAPSKEDVLKLPEKISRALQAIVLDIDEKNKKVSIAVSDPKIKDLKSRLKNFFVGYSIELKYALSEDIDNSRTYYHKELKTRFDKIVKNSENIATDLIDEILNDAILYKASDIHFEPQDEAVVLRFRVDGVLYESGSLKKEHYETVLNKIKIEAGLRIDEHHSAQDGAIRIRQEDKKIDLRVSIAPTVNGEKIVIRVLSEYIRGSSLQDIGLDSFQNEIVNQSVSRPIGMIIVSGPTGSGKTTTLYSILKTLNKPDKNITTIEDPVEYKVKGINQIQVDKQKDITFAKGLRSVVRQDPDIILIGEIRDQETAQLSVNAALTGHLLLSTFHANDAATTIPRMLDMGIEPFLLSSTVDLIMSQRLI
ncbi:GspE/PulE family protein, partial [Candidatus Pacebacteria bacterium]|nr:GspE/PulE family protein [Candidatus Paceibacterota bacterium]